jgi:hypothetical protein
MDQSGEMSAFQVEVSDHLSISSARAGDTDRFPAPARGWKRGVNVDWRGTRDIRPQFIRAFPRKVLEK